jgi:hypothetical protein
MALETWHVYGPGITYNTSKSLADITNGDATKIAKVWRWWLLNNQTSAITGVVLLLVFRRLTAVSTAGTTLTPVAHDTNNAALDADITCGTGRTTTPGSTFRRIMVSSDEPAASGGTWDELECIVPNQQIWDSGYGDANVQPMTLRQNQGMDLQQTTTSVVGVCDIDFEFTQE